MRTIIKDIAEELLKDSAIVAIVGTRIYGRQPKKEPTEPYIIIKRQNRLRNDIRDLDRIRLTMLSAVTADLENLGELIIGHFHQKNVIGETASEVFYYKIDLLNEVDGEQSLRNGFLWKIQNYRFYKTD